MNVLHRRDLLNATNLTVELARERRRAARSGRSVLVIRLESPVLLGRGNRDRDAVLQKIFSITRQTDIVGWSDSDKTLGVICTEFGQAQPEQAGKAITQKIRTLLGQDGPGRDERVLKITYRIEDCSLETAKYQVLSEFSEGL